MKHCAFSFYLVSVVSRLSLDSAVQTAKTLIANSRGEFGGILHTWLFACNKKERKKRSAAF